MRLIGDGEKGLGGLFGWRGEGYGGGGRGKLFITVTTRMTPALRWAAEVVNSSNYYALMTYFNYDARTADAHKSLSRRAHSICRQFMVIGYSVTDCATRLINHN